jgi:hypothetical protein
MCLKQIDSLAFTFVCCVRNPGNQMACNHSMPLSPSLSLSSPPAFIPPKFLSLLAVLFAYLDEPNVPSLLLEALPAHVQVVLADQTVAVACCLGKMWGGEREGERMSAASIYVLLLHNACSSLAG